MKMDTIFQRSKSLAHKIKCDFRVNNNHNYPPRYMLPTIFYTRITTSDYYFG